MNKTTIEWADYTSNPVTGCESVSESCCHCYARAIANRFWGGRPFSDIRLNWNEIENARKQLKRLKEPSKIFICSMSDLFHPKVPIEMHKAIMGIATDFEKHTFQILTKRVDRMREFFDAYASMPNMWLGVTAENQARWDERVPILMKIPAGVHFVSVEPCLGPINIGETKTPEWVICGKETGTGVRPMKPGWAIDIYMQAKCFGSAFFYKNSEIKGLPKEFPK